MASVKYNRLATEDEEERISFDFSSTFTYEDTNHKEKYKSYFTYGNKNDVQLTRTKSSVEQTSSDRFTWLLVYLGYMVVYLMTFPVLVWFSFKRVKDGERMVVFRLGHIQKAKGPGLALVLPFLDRYHKKDVRLRAFSVPPKQIITGDKAIIEVGAEIYFQIVDVVKSVTNVQDLDQSTRILVQTALCNMLAQRNLADIESERRAVADSLLEKSNATCKSWGVQITRAELSQIKVLSPPLPKQAPSVMMPPGLFGNFGSSGVAGSNLPAALAQLASSVTNSNEGQTEAITQALYAMTAPHLSKPAATATEEKNTRSGAKSSATAGPPIPFLPATETASATTSVTPTPTLSVREPGQVLSMIQAALCKDLVRKVQETFQVEVSGVATYFLNLRDGQGSISEGPDPTSDPSATLTMTFDDLQAMLAGQLKPYQAYMSGRLHVVGDLAAALKLEELGYKIQAQLVAAPHV